MKIFKSLLLNDMITKNATDTLNDLFEDGWEYVDSQRVKSGLVVFLRKEETRWGGEEMTQDRLMERVKELKK